MNRWKQDDYSYSPNRGVRFDGGNGGANSAPERNMRNVLDRMFEEEETPSYSGGYTRTASAENASRVYDDLDDDFVHLDLQSVLREEAELLADKKHIPKLRKIKYDKVKVTKESGEKQSANAARATASPAEKHTAKHTASGNTAGFGSSASGSTSKGHKPPKSRKTSFARTATAVIVDIIAVLAVIVMIPFMSMVFVSGAKSADSDAVSDVRNFEEEVTASIQRIRSKTVEEVYALPAVYILPWSENPCPVPKKENYTATSYKDETIEVNYYTERIYRTAVHFAEVKIAHPTQLRTAFAGGKYGLDTRYNPEVIAKHVNAVIATNADFVNYRTSGVVIRQNVSYRNSPHAWDTLLIDSDGNFHIMNDYNIKTSNILKKYNIVNTLSFGPSLIIDGKINILNKASGCGENWNYKPSPRTAIGQIGPLHYLMVCAEGRSKNDYGLDVDQMAQIMLDKGCVQAYNLDGGQSTTMILGGKPMNDPLWGGRRVMSDIVYFATAVPNE